ncbi:hypothetical protein GpartN1_g2039.t1 [Galdieria partita]|uniref:Uncharacterized protein n=1 Tax=Galdieria partita TaxID=83374 RepID=A0A9C7PT39_9RHOD|nr:hypothetical protein GpartN1_g2039.t1 [Galdieria partita]
MSTNGSLKESLNERHFYPIDYLLQKRRVPVPPYYEKELDECKLLQKTVASVTETSTGKGERQKRTTHEESNDECTDSKHRVPAEGSKVIGNSKCSGTKASDGKTQDQRTERKPKQDVASNASRPHNERSKPRGSSGRAETFYSSAPQPLAVPPGFEKLGLQAEEKLERLSEKSHLSERTKEGVFQSTFLEKGGRFAKGPDEFLSFQRPQSFLLKEWNQTEVPESLSLLVDLSRTYFIQENVRKVVESVLAVVERNFACSCSKKERSNIASETEVPERETATNDIHGEITTEALMSNSSEVTVEDEDIEKIVLAPGLLMSMPYDHSMNNSGSVKQSRVTKWTEELDEPASQEQTVHANSQQSEVTTPVELEKNIDSFLASVRKRTLSKKNSVHHATGHVHHFDDETPAHAYSGSSDLLLIHSSPLTEETVKRQNERSDKSMSFVSHKQLSHLSPNRDKDLSKTWKPAVTAPIALIDPAICDAKIKTPANAPTGAESPGSTLDAKYHSPVWSRPIGTNNVLHQSMDSRHLLMNLLGGRYGQSNGNRHVQEDSKLEQNMEIYPPSFAHIPSQTSHRKKAVYAEDLEQALIARTLNTSKQDADASRTDPSMPLLKDSIRHLEKSFM